MKKLFCVVLTDLDLEGLLESPLIYHIKAETQHQAEEKAMTKLMESLAGLDTIEDVVEEFDLFSFPVDEGQIWQRTKGHSIRCQIWSVQSISDTYLLWRRT
jgi:hypothetical protein